MIDTIRSYYWLTKPGIVFSNVIAGMAGFFLACGLLSTLDLKKFLGFVFGTVLVIASACVFNNYIDRNIDRKMKRTSWRATAQGRVSGRAIFVYTTILGLAGFGFLLFFTTRLTVAAELAAYVLYVGVYGYAKRKTTLSTLIGAAPGALPPVAGYMAVTASPDIAALLLFLIMACWQMAHFYAIGMRRHDDYKAAGLPVMPVVKGMGATKLQIMIYIVAFGIANMLLSLFGYVGVSYFVVMMTLSICWFMKGLYGFRSTSDQRWSKKMFLFSLVTLLSFCAMVSVGALLP